VRTCARADLLLGDDFADEGLADGWGVGDLQGVAEHLFGFGEEGFIFAEQGEEGLAGFEFVA
jgi:hypothetical protein